MNASPWSDPTLISTEIGGEQKWRQLGDLAMHQCDLQLASKCLQNAQDYGGVLLLASATGDAQALESLASGSGSGDKYNVSFLSYFMMGKLEECLDLLVKSDRLPEVNCKLSKPCPRKECKKQKLRYVPQIFLLPTALPHAQFNEASSPFKNFSL